jgi:hypothetical protein
VSVWTQKHTNAFNKIKQALMSDTVLEHPVSVTKGREYVIQTDASNKGLGAVLSQPDETDELRLIVLFTNASLVCGLFVVNILCEYATGGAGSEAVCCRYVQQLQISIFVDICSELCIFKLKVKQLVKLHF